MFSKSNLLATLVGAIVMFFLGYLIWGIATVDFFTEHTIVNTMKETPDLALIAVSNVIGAFIFEHFVQQVGQRTSFSWPRI